MTATPDSTAPQDSAPTPDDAAPVLGEQGRPEPPQAGDETATLRGFLDFQRATFAWRTDGLDAEGLRRRLIVHQQARPESMDEARQILQGATLAAVAAFSVSTVPIGACFASGWPAKKC